MREITPERDEDLKRDRDECLRRWEEEILAGEHEQHFVEVKP